MNYSNSSDKALDPIVVTIVGWGAVVIFIISLTIFLTQLQKSVYAVLEV